MEEKVENKKGKTTVVNDSNEWLDQLYKIRLNAEQSSDKLIVYLSSGGIIVSLTVFFELMKLDYKFSFFWLIIILFIYCTSLLLNLFSHQYTVKAVDSKILQDEFKSSKNNNIVKRFNFLSKILFSIGSILLIIFIGVSFYANK